MKTKTCVGRACEARGPASTEAASTPGSVPLHNAAGPGSEGLGGLHVHLSGTQGRHHNRGGRQAPPGLGCQTRAQSKTATRGELPRHGVPMETNALSFRVSGLIIVSRLGRDSDHACSKQPTQNSRPTNFFQQTGSKATRSLSILPITTPKRLTPIVDRKHDWLETSCPTDGSGQIAPRVITAQPT